MKFYAYKFSKKTLPWFVLIIAMFQINHRNVFFETSHCFSRIFRTYFVFPFFIKYKLNTK